MTIAELLSQIKTELKTAKIETWSIDARLIVEEATGLDRLRLITHDTDEADETVQSKARKMADRRLTLEPMQYILGHCEFMGLDFKVDSNTLIPRPDTENIAERVITAVNEKKYKNVLDMCTGSGAIAVSVAHYTQAKVTGVDISAEALNIAEINAENNNVSVELVQSNLFENVRGRFDVIVSNPPYIESEVISELSPQVKNFEPLLALDGGDSGLDFYEKIVDIALEYLNDGGMLVFEIGYNQGKAVSEIMKNAGYSSVTVEKDLAGLDRVVSGFYLK